MSMLQSSPDLNVGETLRRVEVESQGTREQHRVLQWKHSTAVLNQHIRDGQVGRKGKKPPSDWK